MQYPLIEYINAEDLANAVEDEFGVMYSKDGLKLLDANDSIIKYVVKSGTRVICDRAFADCSGLTSVTIPNSVTSIGGYAFYGCSGITRPIIVNDMFVFLPKSYKGHYSIPENISKIIGGAFSDCVYLTSVTIPNSVTSIGDEAFFGCRGLTSVTIPNSVKSIGDGAFKNIDVVYYSGSATGAPWGANRVLPYNDRRNECITITTNNLRRTINEIVNKLI